MLRGNFDAQGRPYVGGVLVIPRFNLYSDIRFLVDTGADTTTLSPRAARIMGLQYSQLRHRKQSLGVGGEVTTYSEQATVIFFDGPHDREYEITLDILPDDDLHRPLPSLLGRDILNLWTMHYSPVTDELGFETDP